MSNGVWLGSVLLASALSLVLTSLNLRHFESSLKQFALVLAELLHLAENRVPLLRNSQIDNYLRDVLRSYAQLDPIFVQSLEAAGETAEHVADVLPLLDPDLQTLGKALSSPPDRARSAMCSLVHHVKHYSDVLEQMREDIKRSV